MGVESIDFVHRAPLAELLVGAFAKEIKNNAELF